MSRFWADGFWSHISQLHKEMKEKTRPLEEHLKTERDQQTRDEIKKRIREIKKEYAQKESNYGLLP